MATNASEITGTSPATADAPPATDADDWARAQEFTDKIIAEESAVQRPRDETGKFVSTKPAEESETATTEEAATDEDAAPQETEATGEDDGTDPEATPPLELPRSWAQDRKDVWTKLDRATQEYLTEHDSKASAAVRQAQNEAAEARKSGEKTAELQRQYGDVLNFVTSYVNTGLDPVIAEWNSTDRAKLALEDPIAMVSLRERYEARKEVLQAAFAEQQRLAQHQQNEAKQAYGKRLAETFPDYADPVKGKAMVDKWAPLLLANGFTQEEVSQTRDVQWDPRHLKVFNLLFDKASKHDQMVAARKTVEEKKVAPPAVKVARPKAQDDGKVKSPRVAALEKQAKEGGSLWDKAAAFAAIIEEESRQ